MAVSIGPKIGIDGEAQYRAEIQRIIQQSKTLDAEMKAVSASFADGAKSEEAAAKQAELLNQKIETQKERVAALADMVKRSAELTGENSAETLKWKEALANAEADLNKLSSGLDENASFMDKLKQAAAEAGPAIQKGVVAFAQSAAAALAAMAAATGAALAAIGKGIADTAAYGDEIDKMSQKMGISAQAYQEWDFILQHSGSSIESLKGSMKTLATAVESGNEAFEEIGLTQQELQSMSQEEIFAATIKGLQGLENETERMYVASKLLGKGATELGPLLNTSAEDIEAMREQVHELGGVMSDQAVKDAAAYQDSLQNLQTAFTGLQRGLLAELMPAITSIMDGITQIFSGDSEKGLGMIATGVDQVIAKVTDKLPEIIELGTSIMQSLLTAIIDNLPKLMESGGELVGQLAAGLITAVPQLIAMVPELISAIVRGLRSAWPNIRQAGLDLISQLGGAISGAVQGAWSWGRDLIQNFINGIVANVTALWDTIGGVAKGIWELLHFSEPEKGPLADFSTWGPDMMKTYAEGIRRNAYRVQNAAEMAAAGVEVGLNAAGAPEPQNYDYGGFAITINQQPGQDANELVDVLMVKLQHKVDARRAVFA